MSGFVDGATKPRDALDAQRAGRMYVIDGRVGSDDEEIATGDAAAVNGCRELSAGSGRPSEVSLVGAVNAFEAFAPVGMWTA